MHRQRRCRVINRRNNSRWVTHTLGTAGGQIFELLGESDIGGNPSAGFCDDKTHWNVSEVGKWQLVGDAHTRDCKFTNNAGLCGLFKFPRHPHSVHTASKASTQRPHSVHAFWCCVHTFCMVFNVCRFLRFSTSVTRRFSTSFAP